MLGFLFAIFYFARLRQFQDPSGADGYFYLKQIQSLSESGQFYFKDYSFSFFPAVLLNVIIRNPLLSYQIASSLCFGFIFYYVRRITNELAPHAHRLAWIVSSILTAAMLFHNATWIELNFVFMKTAVATLFFLVACDFGLRGHTRRQLLFLVLSLLCHKIMWLLVPLAFLAMLVIQKSTIIKSRLTFRWVAAVAVSSATIFCIFGADHFSYLLTRVDISKFSYATFDRYPLYTSTVVLFACVGVIFSIVTLKLKGHGLSQRWMCIFIGCMLILPLLIPDGVGTETVTFRMMLVAAPFFFIAVGLMIQRWSRGVWYGCSICAVMITLNMYFSRPLTTWIIPWSQRIQNIDNIAGVIPQNALIYAPHGLEFYLAYVTQFRPRSFRVEAKGREVFRVAYVRPYLIKEGLLKNDLNQMAVQKLGAEFFLFHESDWLLLNDIHLPRPQIMNLLPSLPNFVADYD